MTDYNLSVEFGSIHLKNPIVADSAGYALSVAGFKRLLKAGCAAVITKSATWEALPSFPRVWDLSPVPRVYWDDLALPNANSKAMDGTEALINPGYKRMAEYIKEVKPLADELGAHLIGSFSPRTLKEADDMAREYEKAGASGIHMDLVCPSAGPFRSRQKAKEYANLGQCWSQTPEMAAEVIKVAKDAVDIPVVPKSFYVKWARERPEAIRMIEDTSKVDILSIHTYTIPNTVFIDIFRGRPYTFPKYDNLDALTQLTVGNTMALAKVAKRPILSAGGLTTAHEAIQMIMAGATALGFCRSIYRDIHVVERVCEELEAYMASQALESLDEIRGIALKYPVRYPNGLSTEHEEQIQKIEKANAAKLQEATVARR